MKKFFFVFPFILFANEEINKILNYHFSIDVSKINSPFYKKITPKKNIIVTKNKNVIRYKLIFIMGEYAKIKVLKYELNKLISSKIVSLHKGDRLNGCKIEKIKDYYVKMICHKKGVYLKLQNMENGK